MRLSVQPWLAAMTLCLATPLARAQTGAPVTITFKVLPPGHDGQIPQVGKVRYYLLNEYLQVAQGDSELVSLRAQVIDLMGVQTGLKRDLVDQGAQIQTLQSDKVILTTRSTRLDTDLNTCNTALSKAGNPIWPYVVAIIGASVGLVGVGMWLGSH